MAKDLLARRDLLGKTQSEPPTSAPSGPVDFSVGEMARNIPGSAKQYAMNVFQPFLHPIDTAEAIGNLAGGVQDKYQRYVDDEMRKWADQHGIPQEEMAQHYEESYPKEQYADQMGQFIVDRYGSVDNFKQTVMQDPVGALADLSLVLTAGGAAAARAPGVIGQIGRATQTVGRATEPLNIAKGVTKAGVAKLTPRGTPTALYESSAKFSTTFPKPKRQALSDTALKHGIMPTSAGVDKLNGLINTFDSKVNLLIDSATESGKTIPKAAIYKHLNALRRELGGMKMEAGENLAQVNRVAKELDTHLKSLGKKTLTPNELQAIKQDAYKLINFDAKNLRSNIGTDKARKAIGRAAKESIESVADVKEFNKELGELLELRDPLQRSAGRIENRNIIGIDTPIKIAAGQAAADTVGAATGTGLSILEHPKMKARIAIKLRQVQDLGMMNLIDHKVRATLAQYGLFQAGRLDDESPPRNIEGD